MHTIQNEKRPLVLRQVVALAAGTWKATWRQTAWLAICGLILPQLAMSLMFDIQGVAVVSELRALFTANVGTSGSPPAGFSTLLAPALAYVSRFLGGLAFGAVVFLATYFALIHVAVAHLRHEPLVATPVIWLRGLRHSLPGGACLLAATVILALVGQFLLVPAVIGGVLALLIPVIYVTENKSALAALASAMRLRYVRGSPYSPWTVVFALLSLGSLAYIGIAGLGLLATYLLELDQYVGAGRELWIKTVPGQPFSFSYLIVSIVETCISMSVIACLPALTVALYFTVAMRREIAQG